MKTITRRSHSHRMRVLDQAASFDIGGLSGLDLWLRANQAQLSTGGAIQFTAASSQYASVADNATHSAGDVDFMICCWVYLDSTSGHMNFITHWLTTGNQRGYRLLYHLTPADFRFAVSGDGTGSTTSLDSGLSPATATWYFIAAWHEPTENKIYMSVNGAAPTSAAHTTGIFDGTAAFRIGATGDTDQFMDGRLARVCTMKPPTALGDGTSGSLANTIFTRMYNSGNGLTWAEITAAERTNWGLNSGNGSWYNQNEGDTTTLVDSVAAVNLTSVNTPTVANGPAAINAADSSSNANHGTLAGFTDVITPWRADDTPDGSLEGRVPDNSTNSNAGVLVGYADADTARTTDTPNGILRRRVDDGQGSNDGNLIGYADTGDTCRTSDVPSVLSGKSITFDGTDDYVRVPDDATLDITDELTVCFWIKKSTAGVSAEAPLAKGRTADTSLAWQINVYGADVTKLKWLVSLDGGSTNMKQYAYSTGDFTDGSWHHIAMTFGSSTLKIYYDGVEDSTPTKVTDAAVASVNTSAADIAMGVALGADDSLGGYIDCEIDDVRIYDTAVKTGAEILAIKNGTDDTTNLVSKWSFEESDTITHSSDQSLTLDGTDDYVELSHAIGDYSADTAGSISAWFKVSASGTNNVIMAFSDKGDASSEVRFQIEDSAGQRLEFAVRENGVLTLLVRSGFSVNDGSWHHVCITNTTTGNALYFDGVNIGTYATGTSATDAWLDNVNDLDAMRIGVNEDSGGLQWFMDGEIDDIRYYDDALTANEVLYLYTDGAEGTDPTSTNLQYHADFEESNTRSLPVLGAGYALEFNGSSDYIALGTEVLGTAVNGAAAITMAAWLNPSALTGANTADSIINGLIDGAATSLDLSLRDDAGVLGIRIGGRSQTADSFQSSKFIVPLKTDTWHHAVGVLDIAGDQIKIYFNGVLVLTEAATFGSATYSADGSPLEGDNLAGYNAGSNLFPGVVDDARIYDDELTADEVLWLYTEGASGTDPTDTNLQGQWKLDDGPQTMQVADGDPIQTWEDSSTNRKVFLQATRAAQPTWNATDSNFNNRPTVTFDGTDDLLQLAESYLSGTEGCFWAVVRPTSFTDNPRIFSSSDTGTTTSRLDFSMKTTGNEFRMRQQDAGDTADDLEGDTTLLVNTVYIIIVHTDGTASGVTIRVNGNEETITVAGGGNNGDWFGDTTLRDNCVIGALTHTSTAQYLVGQLAELGVCSAENAGDITNLEEELADYYGVTLP